MKNKKQHVESPIAGDAIAHAREGELMHHQAIKELMLAMPADFKQQMAGTVQSLGGVTALGLREFSYTLFNQVMGLGLDKPASEQQLDDLLAWLKRYASPVAAVTLAHGAEPAQLPQWLEARGLMPAAVGMACFWREPTPATVPESPFTLRQAGPEDADLFAEVFCQSFGFMPHFANWFKHLVGRENWATYLAFEGETAVATGSIFLHNGMAWLGGGGTLEAYRGRGAQNLLLAYRIEQARKAGVRAMAIETGHPGEGQPVGASYRNILRAGFTLSGVLQRYML